MVLGTYIDTIGPVFLYLTNLFNNTDIGKGLHKNILEEITYIAANIPEDISQNLGIEILYFQARKHHTTTHHGGNSEQLKTERGGRQVINDNLSLDSMSTCSR